MTDPTETALAETQIAEPKTARVIGRPFEKGHVGMGGRPRKGETLAERLARADAAVARKAIRARDRRLVREDQTGNRAWENYLAYRIGLPKQAFVVETQDAPMLAWLEALAAGKGAESTARELPAPDPGDGSDNDNG